MHCPSRFVSIFHRALGELQTQATDTQPVLVAAQQHLNRWKENAAILQQQLISFGQPGQLLVKLWPAASPGVAHPVLFPLSVHPLFDPSIHPSSDMCRGQRWTLSCYWSFFWNQPKSFCNSMHRILIPPVDEGGWWVYLKVHFSGLQIPSSSTVKQDPLVRQAGSFLRGLMHTTSGNN